MGRKAISPKTRQLVYQKCNGHCAYCGCELEYKDMQVDHIVSVYINEYFSMGNRKQIKDVLTDDELNSISNFMPSCRACNFYKGTSSLESFRKNLSTMLYRNLKDNFNYKLLKKYELISENIHPVKFYFEEMGCCDDNNICDE